jgi:hypothetical protein
MLLTFSSEEHPANPSPSQEDERDWMTRVVTWPSSLFDLLAESAPVGWFGRTCPEFYPQMVAMRSEHFSRSWPTSGMASSGECSTLDGSEYPSDAVASSLSDILETGDHLARYFLSARACAGILRRADVRGRGLPTELEEALKLWAKTA